jgi:hypothetical protein
MNATHGGRRRGQRQAASTIFWRHKKMRFYLRLTTLALLSGALISSAAAQGSGNAASDIPEDVYWEQSQHPQQVFFGDAHIQHFDLIVGDVCARDEPGIRQAKRWMH